MDLSPLKSGSGKGTFMIFKKIIIGFAVFFFTHVPAGFTQEEEISDEDLEVIQIFEILENMELLEEDIDFLETVTEIGDEDET